jgi:hypothetical protein
MSSPLPPPAVKAAYQLCAVIDGVPNVQPPPGWTFVSGWPTVNPGKGVFASVARNTSGQYAVVIQGTRSLQELLEEVKVVPQPVFPSIAAGSGGPAAISVSSQALLDDLLQLTDESGTTLWQWLTCLPSTAAVLFTGHSLGGNLASVLLPYTACQGKNFNPSGQPISSLPDSLTGITFATPTAGNGSFAEFLNRNSASYQAWFNINDFIPHVWAVTGSWSIGQGLNLFPAPGPSPAPGWLQKKMEEKITEMTTAKVTYVQTNAYTFTVPPEKIRWSLTPWEKELDYEHNTAYDTYFGVAQG